MSTKYQLHSDGFVFDFSQDDLPKLDLQSKSNKSFHLIKDGQSHDVQLISVDIDDKAVSLSIDGARFDINIKDHLDLLIDQMGFELASEVSIKDIEAPMPGLVLEILVEPGSEVEKGDNLLILEAMKMENVIKAPGDGVVKSIHMTKGAAVEKGALLIEME